MLFWSRREAGVVLGALTDRDWASHDLANQTQKQERGGGLAVAGIVVGLMVLLGGTILLSV